MSVMPVLHANKNAFHSANMCTILSTYILCLAIAAFVPDLFVRVLLLG